MCIDSPYTNEKAEFEGLVESGCIDKLVARYPLRESGVLGAIAGALHLKRNTYERTLIARVREDASLARKLRQRLGPLAEVLGDEAATISE